MGASVRPSTPAGGGVLPGNRMRGYALVPWGVQGRARHCRLPGLALQTLSRDGCKPVAVCRAAKDKEPFSRRTRTSVITKTRSSSKEEGEKPRWAGG